MGLLLSLYPFKDDISKPKFVFQYIDKWSLLIDNVFWNSFDETWKQGPKDMPLEYRINHFVIINLIFSCPYSPTFSFLDKKQNVLNGIDQLNQAIKGQPIDDNFKNFFWTSQEGLLCNTEAIKMILLSIIIQANRGGVLKSQHVNYKDYFIKVDLNSASTIICPEEIESCLRTELRAYLSAYQLPGELGLSLHAERICLLKITISLK
jgi:hypothetical protein